MSVLTGALGMGRAHTLARMTETVTVGTYVEGVDPVTFDTVTVFTSHYAGIGQIKYFSLVVSESTPVGQAIAAQDVVLKLPHGKAGAVLINDTVTVTASEVDDDLVGRTFRIKGESQSGQVTASRFPVEAQ